MKKMENMGGFFVAAITPFDAQGKFNAKALHAVMDKTIGEGAAGFLVGGSSAECPLLTHQEREEGLVAASQYAERARTKLMASVAALSTEEAIAYAKLAKELSYDAMISTVPYYYKFGMKAIAGYFRALREAVDLPLFLYNFPGNTGIEIDIADEHIRGILTDGTIAGVKQTSLNLHQMERIKAMNPELVIYGGFDEVYIGARILGADGAIGSTFNFTLPLFTKIEAAYAAHDIPLAQELQRRANNIMQACVSCSLFPSIKHMLYTQGIDCGGCRAPFPTLTDEQKAYVEKIVAENM
ncbi:MAG: dihydrodipicolinate synthase family protein [Clostridia bacterium]|nr:dihydrodipicolinate synthase family protein [Clostridia bacterium]